jgi:hypothetical protein
MKPLTWLVQPEIADEHLLQLLGRIVAADSRTEIWTLPGGSETGSGENGVRRRCSGGPCWRALDRRALDR